MTPKLRNRLIKLVLVMLAVTVALNLSLNYHYAHVPLRSTIIPRGMPQVGQAVQGLAFSPDSQRLAAADAQNGTSLWNLPQLVCDRRFERPSGDNASVSWIPDGTTIIDADSIAVRRWDVRGTVFGDFSTPPTSTVPKSARGKYRNVFERRVVSPSGNLAAGFDVEGDVLVWSVPTGKVLSSVTALPSSGDFGPPTDFCDVAFSPDDRFIAFSSMAGDNSVADAPLDIVIRDVQTGRILRQWQWKEAYLAKVSDGSGGNMGDTGLVFSPDSRMLATANEYRAAVWDVQTGKIHRTLAETGSGWGGRKKLTFCNNGHLLAGCGWGDFVPVWSVETGNLVQTFHADYYTAALAASPDSRLLATGGQDKNGDGRIELWDISRFRQGPRRLRYN